MRVEITFDDHELKPYLAAWQEPEVRKTLGKAASAFGRTVRPIIAAATPNARPGNAYAGSAGNLERLTKSRRMKRRYGIGVVIGPMGKGAFYRRFVVGGTKPHLILPKTPGGRLKVLGGYARVVHHPGARANDYVARAGRAAEGLGFRSAELVLYRGLQAQNVANLPD